MTMTNTAPGPNDRVRREPTGTATNPPADTEAMTTEEKRVVYSMGTGSSAEALAGIGTVTLAIIGLAGLFPFAFASIAAIVAGGALMLEGLTITGAYAEETRMNMIRAGRREEAAVGSAMSAQTLGGAAGVTLGILALAGAASWSLLATAAIVFGGTLLLSGPARGELLEEHAFTAPEHHTPARYTGEAVKSSVGGMALSGLAALALGILALIGVGNAAPTLVLVAFLVVGGANLLGGSALVTRLASGLR